MEESFEELLRLAENGDAKAQQTVGLRYYYGMGVEQNRELAAEWFARASINSLLCTNTSSKPADKSTVSAPPPIRSIPTQQHTAPQQPVQPPPKPRQTQPTQPIQQQSTQSEQTAQAPSIQSKQAVEQPTQNQTQEQAQTKPANKKSGTLSVFLTLLVPTIGITLLGISLCVADFGYIALFIGIILIAFSVLYCIFATVYIHNENVELYCPKCKEKYNYDTDIEYNVTSTDHKTHKLNPNHDRSKQIESAWYYNYKIKCSCHKCNHNREYNKKLLYAVSYYDGKEEIKNPEYTLERYYTSEVAATGFTNKKFVIGSRIVGAVTAIAAIVIFIFTIIALLHNADPKDYYDTYYCNVNDTNLMSWTFDRDYTCTVRVYEDSTTSSKVIESKMYTYEYKSSSELEDILTFDSKYDGRGALVVIAYDTLAVFWLIPDGFSYRLESNNGNMTLTQNPPSKNLNHAPQNCYGSYYCIVNDSTLMSWTFERDYTCTERIYIDSRTYRYEYKHSSDLKNVLIFDSKYNGYGAFVVKIPEYPDLIFWLIPDGSSYRLERNDEEMTLTQNLPTADNNTYYNYMQENTTQYSYTAS